jgi:hypothetical protein
MCVGLHYHEGTHRIAQARARAVSGACRVAEFLVYGDECLLNWSRRALQRLPSVPTPGDSSPMTVEALAAPVERLPEDPTPETAAIGVRVLDSGIIHVTLPVEAEITGAEARAVGAAVRALADGRRVPVMLVITGVLGVSVEARQVYASSIAASAVALVGESPVDRVIAHYLLRSKVETIPAQFFTSEAEAAEWLGRYTSEH